MAYHIAVCDDNPTDSAYVRSLLDFWAKERKISIQAETFPSSEAFLFRYAEDKTFDFLLLDIEMGKISGVEVDGEQMRVVSRFGRATKFSVRDVSSVSRSLGWIVLYDREFKILAKVDSYLEDMERLKEYMASYGIKM